MTKPKVARMADGAERPRAVLVFFGEALDEALRNPLDKLPEDGVCCLRWLGKGAPLIGGALAVVLFFHPPVGYRQTASNASFFCQQLTCMGW